MPNFTDQMGNTIHLSSFPKRIISLVPSQTELLFDLGLDKEVAGITKFCIHPKEKFKSVTKIGGTKDFKLDRIKELQPDLIIGNKEENEQSKITGLQKEFPVWMSDIGSLSDALDMINSIGELVGRSKEARNLSFNIEDQFNSLQKNKPGKHIKVLYLIWRNPFMAAGKSTFINEMLNLCGFENAIQKNRYPEFTTEQLKELEIDEVFLSSEPYPFKQKHIEELKEILPQAKIRLVDGELFSWYGSRLLKSVDYFLKEFI